MDEYKTLPYLLEPERYANVDAGDLTKALEIRKNLKCKPFHYFLKYVAPDMANVYPPLAERPRFASGSIRSLANPRLCMDSNDDYEAGLILNECSENIDNPPHNQLFELTMFKSIVQRDLRYVHCLDSYGFKLHGCNDVNYGNQFWIFDTNTKRLVNNKKCITHHLNNDTISLSECKDDDMTQKWEFSYVNTTAMEQYDQIYGYNSILSY